MKNPLGAISRMLAVRLLLATLLCCLSHTSSAVNLGLAANPNPSSTGTYTITWNNFGGDGFFRLQERVGGTGSWYNIHFTATGSSFTVTGRAPGIYQYRIVWSNPTCDLRFRTDRRACERIPQNSETLIVTVANAPPGKPQNVSTNPAPEAPSGPTLVRTNQGYSVYWPAVAGATSYEVEERLDSSKLLNDPNIGIWSTIYSGTLTSINIYPKKIESQWSYHVRACHPDSGCGEWSDIRRVTVFLWVPPPEPPPPPPTEQDEIESAWDGFGAALDNGNVTAAMEFFSPTVRSRYEPALLALGDDVRNLTSGWSGIKEIKVENGYAEYTVFVTRNGQTRLHIITLQQQNGVWRLLEF